MYLCLLQMLEKITDNKQKIKQNKVLPYLVGNVVEVSPTLLSSLARSQTHTDLSCLIRSLISTLRTRTMELS